MTDKAKNHSPQHEELLKKQALEQQEVTEVMVFIRKYAKPAGILLAVVIVASVGLKMMQIKQQKTEVAADLLLMKASAPEDYEAVVAQYASTKAASFAEMALALEQFNAGQYEAAATIYDGFIAKSNDPEMLPVAKLNQISCKEAAGQMADAVNLYGAFASENSSSYLAPMALMAKARCLESLGKWAEAKTVYEDLLVNEGATAWTQQVNLKLEVLEGKS